MTAETRRAIVEFWRRMNLNDWGFASELFAPGCVIDWPQSLERIRGAENFVALNAAYPTSAPWRFDVVSLVVDGENAVTETRVANDKAEATAVSFFVVSAGRIVKIREFWPDPYEAPDWRGQWVEKL